VTAIAEFDLTMARKALERQPFAGGTVLGPAVLTGGLAVRYARPATGRVLRAHAEVVQAGRRQAVVRCDVRTVAEDGTEALCAVAQGTVLPVRTS